jgi:hypothetical protein
MPRVTPSRIASLALLPLELIAGTAFVALLAASPAFGQVPAAAPSSLMNDADQPPIAEAPAGPAFVRKSIDLATEIFGEARDVRKNGFYPEFSNTITGSGFDAPSDPAGDPLLESRVRTVCAPTWQP